MMIREDHRQHFLYSGGLTILFGLTGWLVGVPLWIAALAVLGIGAGRELAQWQRWMVGNAEWSDMAANVGGIVAALFILYGVGLT